MGGIPALSTPASSSSSSSVITPPNHIGSIATTPVVATVTDAQGIASRELQLPLVAPVPPTQANGLVFAEETLPAAIAQGLQTDAKKMFLLCLEDCLSSELLLSRATEKIEQQQTLFERLSKQQHVLYQEYSTEAKKWIEEKGELKRKITTLTDKGTILTKKIDQLEQVRHLQQPISAQQARLEQENLVLQFDFKNAKAQLKFANEELENVRKGQSYAKEEMLQLQTVSRTRYVAMDRRRAAAEGREHALTELTKNWVPRELLLQASQKHVNLLEEHRQVLARHADLREKEEGHLHLRMEHMKLQREFERVQAIVEEHKIEEKLAALTNTDHNGDARIKHLQNKYEITLHLKQSAEETTQKLLKDNLELDSKYMKGLNDLVQAHTETRTLKAKLEGCCDHQKALQLHSDLADLRTRCLELEADLKSAKANTKIATEHARSVSSLLATYEKDSELNQECTEIYNRTLEDFIGQGTFLFILSLSYICIHISINRTVLITVYDITYMTV